VKRIRAAALAEQASGEGRLRSRDSPRARSASGCRACRCDRRTTR
jgi:hypothetical protein